jgi:hypothetical protein
LIDRLRRSQESAVAQPTSASTDIRAHQRMIKRRLKVMFPVEDSGSFASLLAALDNQEADRKSRR